MCCATWNSTCFVAAGTATFFDAEPQRDDACIGIFTLQVPLVMSKLARVFERAIAFLQRNFIQELTIELLSFE